ncbi:MAG TPA: hypothetical protein VNS88_06250 [Nitrospiraceae bacterium]|nr:hypothetical protein [Nitrospiraceae bacterium]
MATIRELWIPSPHNSSPRGAYLKGAFHTTEGAQKIRDLGSWFQNPSAGCSSHHGSDNYERGLFGAYVYESNKAWTQGNGNSVCLSLEQCTPSGAASGWSRDTWLSKTILIDNAAEWMHYMAEKYSLPYKWLNNSEAQDSWSKGFCEHVNGGSSWSGHHDCGNGFPNDVVMDKARAWGSGSGSAPEESSGGLLVSSAVAYYEGKQYYAYIRPDGKVCINGGVVDQGSNAKSGVGLAIDQDSGKKTISYTNQGGKLCFYEQAAGSSKWGWVDKGVDAK